MKNKYDVVIVGSGLAGLAAALELEKFDLKVLVLDKSDRVGGRVKTDEVDGFLLDHGFQVYLSQYPEGINVLDYPNLELHAFDAGALCFDGSTKFAVQDVSRSKLALAKMAVSPVGTFMDKIRLGNLRAELKNMHTADIFSRPETTTLYYLKKKGFSDRIIQRFFKPFFAGIFLEDKLKTSSRMFEFVFQMLALGHATIPAKGMEEIPRQLRSKLSKTEFRFHTEVKSLKKGKLETAEGDTIDCEHIIVASPPEKLIPKLKSDYDWMETATYYFSSKAKPVSQNKIALNFAKSALVNNFSVISNAAPNYAPKGEHLISVSLMKIPKKSVKEICSAIQAELAKSFGDDVWQWEFLRNYHIPHALPTSKKPQFEVPISETRVQEGIYLAGDYLLNASIDGALRSGRLAAQAAVLNFKIF